MIESAQYIKIVEWSDEDECLSGTDRELSVRVATALMKLKFIGSCVRSLTNR